MMSDVPSRRCILTDVFLTRKWTKQFYSESDSYARDWASKYWCSLALPSPTCYIGDSLTLSLRIDQLFSWQSSRISGETINIYDRVITLLQDRLACLAVFPWPGLILRSRIRNARHIPVDRSFRLSRVFLAVVSVLYKPPVRNCLLFQVHSSPLFKNMVWWFLSFLTLSLNWHGTISQSNVSCLPFYNWVSLYTFISSPFLYRISHRHLTRCISLLARLPRIFWQCAMVAVGNNGGSTYRDANDYRQRSLFLLCPTRPTTKGRPYRMPILVNAPLSLILWWVLVGHARATYIYRMAPTNPNFDEFW